MDIKQEDRDRIENRAYELNLEWEKDISDTIGFEDQLVKIAIEERLLADKQLAEKDKETTDLKSEVIKLGDALVLIGRVLLKPNEKEQLNKRIAELEDALRKAKLYVITDRELSKEIEQLLKMSQRPFTPDPRPEKTPNKPRKGIRKVSLTNTSLCSSGERVTNGQIKSRLAAAYKLKRSLQHTHWCEGFPGKPANGFAHIIAQARCKQIGKTELIWNLDNFFPASFEANQAIENPKGSEWVKLKNISHCLTFIHEHDPELFQKFVNNSDAVIRMNSIGNVIGTKF